jgi:hypothetical protein
VRLPMLGRTYRSRYGYPWRWAVLAEIAWRLEHAPLRRDGQPFARLARRAYRWRKSAERRGHPLLTSLATKRPDA